MEVIINIQFVKEEEVERNNLKKIKLKVLNLLDRKFEDIKKLCY